MNKAAKRFRRIDWPSTLRRGISAIIVGGILTILIFWACALWTPARRIFDPLDMPSQALETIAPDHIKGLYYQQNGFGWTYLYLRGERFWSKGKSDILWRGPYGGTFHRLAGWPFYAVSSRVTVLDSQIGGRVFDGRPQPSVRPQRRKWELPWNEILHRGVASKDVPIWFYAKPDRRLALIPLPLGFALDTFFYAIIYFIAGRLGRISRSNRRRNTPAAHPAAAQAGH